jgi:glycosyltransferase involved in cell wall biosynthesis
MKIGVAIPCYSGHVSHLYQLLDSIDEQTVLPHKVVVCSSSTNNIQLTKEYKFPIYLVITPDKKTAAENRNIAIQNLTDMDCVTFFDADDIMHPQRIEILLNTFAMYNCDIILHNYSNATENNNVHRFEPIHHVNARTGTLVKSWSGSITHMKGYNEAIDKIHHSQVTVKQWVLKIVRFPEEQAFYCKEDCEFCFRVFSLPNVQHAYIQNDLSQYLPSQTGGIRS